jgi:hypothetical protein
VTAASIVITNHDHGRFIAQAIDSALAQTHAAVEVVVVAARGDVVEGFYPDYRTGDHREQGAFWITGPGIAAHALASPVSIMDFAPTIGELLGVPLPGLDGRPIPGVAGGPPRESA